MRFLILLLFSWSAVFAQQHQTGKETEGASGHHHHHDYSVEQWLERLESPDRDSWQKPDQVVRSLDLEGGETVADIGAGSGYFSVRLAREVGPAGRVIAVDIDEGLLDYLRDRANKEKLSNIDPQLGKPDDPALPASSVDLVFICNVVHHIGNRPAYYSKLKRSLKADGRLAIVDFYKRELPVGPSPQMKIARAEMIAELQEAGFGLQEEFEFLPYQYFLVFEIAGP